MATSLLRQFRYFSSTVLETGTTVLKRLVTSSCCSKHLMTSLYSAWMAQEQWKISYNKMAEPPFLDCYIARPASYLLNTITLLEFARQFTMSKDLGVEPNWKVEVTARPYEEFCRQSLMQHKAFRQVSDLLAAYAEFETFHHPLKKTSFTSSSFRRLKVQR